jgi:hypothetical protein
VAIKANRELKKVDSDAAKKLAKITKKGGSPIIKQWNQMSKGGFVARSILAVLLSLALMAFINDHFFGLPQQSMLESYLIMALIESLVYLLLTNKMLTNWQTKRVAAMQDGKFTRKERREIGTANWAYLALMLTFAVVSSVIGWIIIKLQLGGGKWPWAYEFALSVIRMSLVVLVNYRAFKKLGMKLMAQPGTKIVTPKVQKENVESLQKQSTKAKLFGTWKRK